MQQHPLLGAIFSGKIGLKTILVSRASGDENELMQRMQDHPRMTDARVLKLPISTIYDHLYLSGSINPVFLEGYRDQWRPRMR